MTGTPVDKRILPAGRSDPGPAPTAPEQDLDLSEVAAVSRTYPDAPGRSTAPLPERRSRRGVADILGSLRKS